MHTTPSNRQGDVPASSKDVPLPLSKKKSSSRFIKVTVDGLEGVGKSLLIAALLKEAVDTSYGGIPSEILPPSTLNITELQRGVEGDTSVISFWENSYTYERLAPMVYNNAVVLLFCFSLDFMGSVEGHLEVLQWKLEGLCSRDFPREIRMPIFMVGCRSDFQDPDIAAARSRAKQYAQSIDMDGYFECSVVTGEGILELLDAILSIALSSEKYTPRRRLWPKKKAWKNRRCVVL